MANIYQVPQWVFIRDTLPVEYRFENTILGFRSLKDVDFHESSGTDTAVRRIMARVETIESLC